jgi:hypothetical protein
MIPVSSTVFPAVTHPGTWPEEHGVFACKEKAGFVSQMSDTFYKWFSVLCGIDALLPLCSE